MNDRGLSDLRGNRIAILDRLELLERRHRQGEAA